MPDASMNVLDLFRQGDPDAFETIFRLHQRAVYTWILRIVRNHAEAEDLTVETFWRIYSARARFDPGRGFGPWARRIATHTALDWLRAQRPAAELPADYAAPFAADPGIRAEIRQKTAQAFARLPARLRVAAILAVVEEQPHREIAEALGISVAAVKVRVFRALRLMRKDLERQGITPWKQTVKTA
ncbi:MAG TPA: sigma-70 family RNA polymerase sigma factor [Terracidiphilus sp.]|nr:sigma-70 family RNA polymerase sigma factor [Terracidiphilus sp.]